MATFWFQPWFQLPTYWQQSGIPSNKKQSINRASIIPTQPMQSYGIQGTILDWVSDDKAKKIVDYVKSTAKTKEEETLMLRDLHQEAIKYEQKEAYNKEREMMKTQLMQEQVQTKDTKQKQSMDLSLKIANFSDIIREWAMKEWIDLSDMNDEELIAKHIQANPNQQQMFLDYVNWVKTSVDVGREIGLIAEPVVEDDWGMSTVGKVWVGVWTTVGALGAMKWIWYWAEKLWKFIYWVTLPSTIDEAKAVQTSEARAWAKINVPATYEIVDWKVVEKTKATTKSLPSKNIIKATDTAIDQKWIYGTLTNIWTKAERRWLELFQNEIAPLLQKTKATVNVQWAIKEVGAEIANLAKWDPDKLQAYTNAFDELKLSFADNKYNSYSLTDTQTLKSWLKARTPQKFFKQKGIAAEITNEVQELKAKLWQKLTQKIHSILNKEYGKWTATKYIDYANLEWLAKVWPKSRAMAWLQWWFGWFNFTLAKEIATPITTTAGKVTYKLWKALQKLPDILLDVAKAGGKWVLNLWKWLLAIDPVNTPELLAMIPWTIWDSFKEFISQNPASIAFNSLMSMPVSKKWKIEKIKEIYKVDDTEAEKIYKWEKETPILISY